VPPPRGTSLPRVVLYTNANEDFTRLTPPPLETENHPADLGSSIVQTEGPTAGGTSQSPPGNRKVRKTRSKPKLPVGEYEEAFETLKGTEGVQATQKDLQKRVLGWS